MHFLPNADLVLGFETSRGIWPFLSNNPIYATASHRQRRIVRWLLVHVEMNLQGSGASPTCCLPRPWQKAVLLVNRREPEALLHRWRLSLVPNDLD